MIGQEHVAGRLMRKKAAFRRGVGIVAGVRSGSRPSIAVQMRQMVDVAGHEEEAFRDGFGHVSVEVYQSDVGGVSDAQRVDGREFGTQTFSFPLWRLGR